MSSVFRELRVKTVLRIHVCLVLLKLTAVFSTAWLCSGLSPNWRGEELRLVTFCTKQAPLFHFVITEWLHLVSLLLLKEPWKYQEVRQRNKYNKYKKLSKWLESKSGKHFLQRLKFNHNNNIQHTLSKRKWAVEKTGEGNTWNKWRTIFARCGAKRKSRSWKHPAWPKHFRT